jgi:hypothetical protein
MSRAFIALAAGLTISASEFGADRAEPGSRDFIRVRNIDGVYWLVDPSGKPFVTIGLNHFNAGFLTAPYNRELMAKKYGDDILGSDGKVNEKSLALQGWFASIFRNMKAWGFNSFGMHVGREIPLTMYRDNVFYLAWLKPVPIDGWAANVSYPDVFSAELEQRVDSYVRSETQKYKDDVNVLGYCYSDIPRWVQVSKAEGRMVSYPWVATIRSLPAASPGKRAYIAHLQSRHAQLASVNATYGTSAATWKELASVTSWPSPPNTARALQEDEQFAAQIAERWYRLQYECIRRYDSNHLVLGDKLNFNLPPSAHRFLYPALAKYVDVILIQFYGDHAERADALRELFAATQTPIINGDSSFAFPNPRQTHSKGIKVGSYREVGQRYAGYLREILQEPYMLGWHYCGYMEGWAGSAKHLEAQSGLVDPFDRPYMEAVSLITEANAHAEAWHRQSAGAMRK